MIVQPGKHLIDRSRHPVLNSLQFIRTLHQQQKKELDNHKIIGPVSMELSKAFDTLPHDLIVSQLR